MGPTRKSRNVNRRYINEVSPIKDGDSAKRSNSKKRKLSDMLGPRWTMEELSCFYDAYRKYNGDWKKVVGALRNRSPEMVEALYTMNRAYLSLPHGAASAAGLIAMMTDHYWNLAESDSDEERNNGAVSSRKCQKRAHGKIQPTTSRALGDQPAAHSQTVTSNYGCLSLLQKKRSGGRKPCPVGKRTPRFPVSFPYENINGEKYVSPTKQGLKLNANADDDELAHEIAIFLAEASQRAGSSHVSRAPRNRAENVMSSPFRHAQEKCSLPDMPSTQIAAADVDERIPKGSTESDSGELSIYKPSMTESTSIGTVKKKTIKLEGNKFEVDNICENHLDDTKETYSETEEGQMFGAPRGKLDVDVANGKISRFTMHTKTKQSKMVLCRRDEAPAFDALQTLADLSLMMQIQDDDGAGDHVSELVAPEALPMNREKGQRKYSGVKKKGHQPLSSSNADSCKTSKPGKASAIVVNSVPEENQDLQLLVTKTPRKKRKVSKIQKTEANPDIHLSGSPGVEDGDPRKELMNTIKKSSQNGAPNILRSPENSSSVEIQNEAKESAPSAEQVLVLNLVNLPTKVRSRRKVALKKPQVQKDLKFPDKIANDRSDLPLASLHDRTFNLKGKLSICLSNHRLRRWCTYEWFYSAIDYPWFAKREFVEYLHHVGLGHVPRLTRVEWGVIRSSLGKPRRFSEHFLKEEKEKLNQYRDSVRKHYSELQKGVRERLPTELARPLSVGQRVIAIHPKTREIHDGSVLTVDHSGYLVQFDSLELGVEFVMDTGCMPLNSYENMPALLGKQTISADKFFENFNESKVNGRECVKLCSGDNANKIDDTSQLSPSANPASLLKQTKVSSNAHPRKGIGSAETSSFHQTAHSQPNTLAQIQAKEADVQALAELTRALDKKEAIIVELRRMNNDAAGHQKLGDCSLKDYEPFNQQYAAVLVQLNEANKQVSSALYCLRQRNTYEGNNLAGSGGGFAFESGPHVNEIIDSSNAKAQAMVDAAMQAMSSLKGIEGTIEKTIDYVTNRLSSDDSSVPAAGYPPFNGSPLQAPDPSTPSASGVEPQIPSELISKCVAALLMIERCAQRQFPPSDVAQILDSAVTSLRPHSSQNLPVYSEIQQCMGIIRHQIMALVPT